MTTDRVRPAFRKDKSVRFLIEAPPFAAYRIGANPSNAGNVRSLLSLRAGARKRRLKRETDFKKTHITLASPANAAGASPVWRARCVSSLRDKSVCLVQALVRWRRSTEAPRHSTRTLRLVVVSLASFAHTDYTRYSTSKPRQFQTRKAATADQLPAPDERDPRRQRLGFLEIGLERRNQVVPCCPRQAFTGNMPHKPKFEARVHLTLASPARAAWRSLCASTRCDKRPCLVQALVR